MEQIEIEQLRVILKTKLNFAKSNYERYAKEDMEHLSLIQAGKVGILEELLEEICEKGRL